MSTLESPRGKHASDPIAGEYPDADTWESEVSQHAHGYRPTRETRERRAEERLRDEPVLPAP